MGNLQIVNQFTEPVSVSVTPGGCTCCDSPAPSAAFGLLAPNATINVGYERTQGHGCDGQQGYFQLVMVGATGTLLVALNFDSESNIGQPTLQWVANPSGGAPFTVQGPGPDSGFNPYMAIEAG